jgi:uncharacterized protein
MGMRQKIIALLVPLVLFTACSPQNSSVSETNMSENASDVISEERPLHELEIESMRKLDYPGSDITVVQKLPDGSNYTRQVVNYKSDDFKIYALMTVPKGNKPDGGWPAIIFNHGYISPNVYKTTEKYVAYQDAFARAGYITFKSDYRGHGSSEGLAEGGYGSPAYTIDVLNALASVQKYTDTNPEKIGMWGHSMGGYITLRAMVINTDIKAGVIWAGVVGSYPDLLNNWRRRNPSAQPSPTGSRRWRDVLVQEYGEPEQNKAFWDSISANSYLDDISGPVELHHGTADSSVPYEFSVTLESELQEKGKTVKLHTYTGDDHNIARNLRTALNRSVAFFDTYLK